MELIYIIFSRSKGGDSPKGEEGMEKLVNRL